MCNVKRRKEPFLSCVAWTRFCLRPDAQVIILIFTCFDIVTAIISHKCEWVFWMGAWWCYTMNCPFTLIRCSFRCLSFSLFSFGFVVIFAIVSAMKCGSNSEQGSSSVFHTREEKRKKNLHIVRWMPDSFLAFSIACII